MSAAQGPISELAERLWNAEIDRISVSPLSDERPGLRPEEAYAVQNRNIERRLAAGRVIRWPCRSCSGSPDPFLASCSMT
jgi:2-keto-4-pentenoate hydratase